MATARFTKAIVSSLVAHSPAARQDQRKIMIIWLSTVLSVASLIGAFAGTPGA
jgi:hypothetical protein